MFVLQAVHWSNVPLGAVFKVVDMISVAVVWFGVNIAFKTPPITTRKGTFHSAGRTTYNQMTFHSHLTKCKICEMPLRCRCLGNNLGIYTRAEHSQGGISARHSCTRRDCCGTLAHDQASRNNPKPDVVQFHNPIRVLVLSPFPLSQGLLESDPQCKAHGKRGRSHPF